jgi:hypothetical protein
MILRWNHIDELIEFSPGIILDEDLYTELCCFFRIARSVAGSFIDSESEEDCCNHQFKDRSWARKPPDPRRRELS